jgi:hypothetical protein
MQTAQLIRLDAKIRWAFVRDETGAWVGVCEALKLTACGDTWAQLCSVIEEIHNDLFIELLHEGQLEGFLRQHGWAPITPLPLSVPPEGVRFDVPVELLAMASRDVRQHA